MTFSVFKIPDSKRNINIWECSKDYLVELFLGDLPDSYSDTVLMLFADAMERIELNVVEGGIYKQGDCMVASFYVYQDDQSPEMREKTPKLLHNLLTSVLEEYWKANKNRLPGSIKNDYDEIELDMDPDNHIAINAFGPYKSIVTVDARDRIGVLFACLTAFVDCKVHVESARMKIVGGRATRAQLTFEISDDGKALDDF